MKREGTKGFITGMLVMALAFGLVGTAGAASGKSQIEVDYKDIRVNLDGYPQKMEDANGNVVEPFSYNGTVYVPVRAISKMFGCGVEWEDKDGHGTVSVRSPASAVNQFYQDTGVPRFDWRGNENTFYDILADEPGAIAYIYRMSYSLTAMNNDVKFAYDVATDVYKVLLESFGFKLTKEDTFSNMPRYTYKNSETDVTVTYYSMEYNDDIYVNIFVVSTKIFT